MPLVDPEARPVRPVVPVDAVTVGYDGSTNGRAVPLCGQLPLASKLTARGIPLFIGQLQLIATLVDRAGLRTVPLRIPGAVQVDARTTTPAAPAGITPCPERSVGPVDLAAVGAERAGHKLPARRNDRVGSLQLSIRGVAILVGEGEESSVATDRRLLRRISLGAPTAGEGRRLLP